MLDLELLRSFVSVVDARGFTRAGERVHRTQSTVSQQIKRLEEDIGQPLLNRAGRDVTRPKPASGCCPMRDDCWRWRRKLATYWRARPMKALSGSASPRISRPIA